MIPLVSRSWDTDGGNGHCEGGALGNSEIGAAGRRVLDSGRNGLRAPERHAPNIVAAGRRRLTEIDGDDVVACIEVSAVNRWIDCRNPNDGLAKSLTGLCSGVELYRVTRIAVNEVAKNLGAV